MTEHEMEPGQEMIIVPNIRMEMGAAMNLHTKAKEIAEIDAMKQEETMKRLLDLAATREGLQTLISLDKHE